MQYHFQKPHLIAAYRNEKFIGIFVTYPKETITIEYLADYFSTAGPTCFVAEEVPKFDVELTPENYMELLEDMIDKYSTTKFSELAESDLVYMPKTLH